MTAIVNLEGVDIIFGRKPKKALPLIDAGLSRDEISHKTGNVVGVAGANLAVQPGEIIVLMGLSGSGKSTLLRAINALAPVIRGNVTVQTPTGPVAPYATSKRRLRKLRADTISMVFQQFALLPWRSVAENVALPLEFAGLKPKERWQRVEEQLELVNLLDWADRPVHTLSGGMQQRVGLARAFATGAPVLLMDEPFSALDPLIRVHLQQELLLLHKKLNKTIIFVSHDLEEAFRLGNRIAIMEGGRIVQTGTPGEIYRNPANAYVKNFVRDMNPLGILTAADVMKPVVSREQLATTVSGTAHLQTPLSEILKMLSRSPGTVGIVERGRIIGTISDTDAVAGLVRRPSFRPTPNADI